MNHFIRRSQNSYLPRIAETINHRRGQIAFTIGHIFLAYIILVKTDDESKEKQASANILQKTDKKNAFTHEAQYPLTGRTTTLATVEIGNCEDLKTIADQWRYRFAKMCMLSLIHFDLEKTSTNFDGAKISDIFSDTLSDKSCSFSYVACFDEEKKIQAIAIVEKKNQGANDYLYALVTNPQNLKKTPESISGSGSALVRHVCHTAKKDGKHIELDSLPGAERFYKKIGFTPRTPSNNSNSGEYISSTVQEPVNRHFQKFS